MNAKPITYTFGTFQELMDVVPADRITTCLTELAVAFSTAKKMADLTLEVAKSFAAGDGVSIPETARLRLIVPEVIEWTDDGKGNLEVGIADENGKKDFTINLKMKETA